MYRDCINKDTLKPGDVVGIRKATQIGWGYFRYPKTIPMTIERITPARTKFVMTNGCEYGKNEPFYPLTEEAKRQTQIANCAVKISKCFSELENLRRDGKLYQQNDDFIVMAADLLERICKEVKNENH